MGKWELPENVPNEDLDAIRDYLSASRGLDEPPDRQWLITKLADLSILFPPRDLNPGQHARLFETFARHLSEYPAKALEAAFDEYARTGEWWPRIADLAAICDRLVSGSDKTKRRLESLEVLRKVPDGAIYIGWVNVPTNRRYRLPNGGTLWLDTATGETRVEATVAVAQNGLALAHGPNAPPHPPGPEPDVRTREERRAAYRRVLAESARRMRIAMTAEDGGTDTGNRKVAT